MDTCGDAPSASPLLPMALCWLPMTARSLSGELATKKNERCWLLGDPEHHHAVRGHHHRVFRFRAIQFQIAVGPEISCTLGCRFQAKVRPLDGDFCGCAAAVK